jgi:NAD(P)-dependent dehydrogenase (short-subunit alcohol dehydrogenase family)
MPLPSLNGQRVVIIGGSSGTGYAIVECALAEGAQWSSVPAMRPISRAPADSAWGRSGRGGAGLSLPDARGYTMGPVLIVVGGGAHLTDARNVSDGVNRRRTPLWVPPAFPDS